MVTRIRFNHFLPPRIEQYIRSTYDPGNESIVGIQGLPPGSNEDYTDVFFYNGLNSYEVNRLIKYVEEQTTGAQAYEE